MSADRIGREFYDRTGYFEEDAGHLTDPRSDFQRYRVRKVLEIHQPSPDERVLDLGCGWGTFSFALAPRVREVVGVDFSHRAVELCHARAGNLGVENTRFVETDARDTGLEAGSFDTVIAADLFEHLYPDDSTAVVGECHRLLRPGGRLVIWTPHRGHLLEILKSRGILLRPDPSHVDYKSMSRLRRLLSEAGFEVERAYYTESHVPLLRTAERLLLPWIPLLRRRIAMLGRRTPSPHAP